MIVNTSEKSLHRLLDAFREKYSGLQVRPAPMDLTDCYWSSDAGRYVAPRSYGPLPDCRVMGYAAIGGAFVRKFAKNDDGKMTRIDGVPLIGRFSLEQQVMACLCVFDMRNTSLFEISDAMVGTHRVQGYRRWHLRELVQAIRKTHTDFEPESDSCFLFAGLAEDILPRIALNALWLNGIVAHGHHCLDTVSPEEAALMETVFSGPVLSGNEDEIARRSYMWGRDIWQPQSAAFLACKASAYRAAIFGNRTRAVSLGQ